MSKKFDQWNVEKKALHASERKIFFKEREVWWCSLGVNVGIEQDGKGKTFHRPVLILKKFSRYQLLILPLSNQVKTHRLRFNFTLKGMPQSALLSQIRVIDSKRLQWRMGRVSQGVFGQVQEAVQRTILV